MPKPKSIVKSIAKSIAKSVAKSVAKSMAKSMAKKSCQQPRIPNLSPNLVLSSLANAYLWSSNGIQSVR